MRLIPDLVAAGVGITVIPETAVPVDVVGMRAIPIADMPQRRLALVSVRGGYLSLADQAVREVVVTLVALERPARVQRPATT